MRAILLTIQEVKLLIMLIGISFDQLTIAQNTGDRFTDTLLKVPSANEILAVVAWADSNTITASSFI